MTAISLLVLRCADLSRSRALYEALGLSFRPEQHGAGPTHYSARADQTVIELYPLSNSGTAGLRLGFTVKSLLERVSEAVAMGATLLKLDVDTRPAYALLEDLDGHKLELTEAAEPSVRIDTTRIQDFASFHEVFSEALGFPDLYGKNMDAWIDCMSSLDQPEDGMSQVVVLPGEVLTLEIEHVDAFARRCPEIYAALIEACAFVNFRRRERGRRSVLALSFNKTPPSA